MPKGSQVGVHRVALEEGSDRAPWCNEELRPAGSRYEGHIQTIDVQAEPSPDQALDRASFSMAR
jgi:hypothetical protein